MKRNTRWYLSAAAAGALLAGAALWAARTFPAAPAAVPGFFGLAGGLLFFCAMAELLSTRDLDPARRERDREDHDERGAMIRAMARARAGDVLLWLLLFGAAYLYFFGVPKWVNITLLGLACVIAKPFKNRLVGVAVGTAAVCGIRFLCSFLSGVLIWGNLSDGLPAWTYSLTYNGSYMLPETILTTVAAVLIYKAAPQLFAEQEK